MFKVLKVSQEKWEDKRTASLEQYARFIWAKLGRIMDLDSVKNSLT